MTVGLVVVSHSRALAHAAAALATEAAPGARIEVAAGLEDGAFGTDAVAVAAAMTAADRGGGVVVLMDLGSAVLSAEFALELLADDAARERVLLCAAPLVEGLVAAAVTAAGGGQRAEVAQEAAAALQAKTAHLGTGPADSPGPESSADAGVPADPADSPGVPAAGAEATVVVTPEHGLHARPAARLVIAVREFDARVEVRNATTGSAWVPGTSLSRVALLGVLGGRQLGVRAHGPEARAAVDAVVELAERAFDDPLTAVVPVSPMASTEAGGSPPAAGQRILRGRSMSPGSAIGAVRRWRRAAVTLPEGPPAGVDVERAREAAAVAGVREDLRRWAGGPDGAIFEAHLLLLGDTELTEDVRGRIDRGSGAAQAWREATEQLAIAFEKLPDDYLCARAADVRDVGEQVVHRLLGTATSEKTNALLAPGDLNAAAPTGAEPATEAPIAADPPVAVLVAADLSASDAAGLDPGRVAGVLLAGGTPVSHAAILLRARGIPAVSGLGPSIMELYDGTAVALDGADGTAVLEPTAAIRAAYHDRQVTERARHARAATQRNDRAITASGVHVLVGANVGSLADARAAAGTGADLAGLTRTEFLVLERDAAPGVDEQEAAYRELAAALGGRRRITLRTLDVGGDKPLRYLPTTTESNPFLGVRGLRHSLAHPELLADQLLAIVRTARDVPVSVLFPMVSTVPELLAARRMLDAAIDRAGGRRPDELHIGMMVEVPAAALKSAAFAPHVDFFSIGTNDLTQYALAAERGNPAVAGLADGLDPGVLRLIDATCRGAAERAGPPAPVAVCGELAADPVAVPLLVGLGVRELSVAPPAVALVKETVRAVGAEAAARAQHALHLPDAADVRR